MEKLKSIKNVTVGTWARLLMLTAALVITAMRLLGITVIPIENETYENLITAAVMVISSAISYWKNNSFTEEAQIADKLMKNLKE